MIIQQNLLFNVSSAKSKRPVTSVKNRKVLYIIQQ